MWINNNKAKMEICSKFNHFYQFFQFINPVFGKKLRFLKINSLAINTKNYGKSSSIQKKFPNEAPTSITLQKTEKSDQLVKWGHLKEMCEIK